VIRLINADAYWKSGNGVLGAPVPCARSTGKVGIRKLKLSMRDFVDAQISSMLFTAVCHLPVQIGNQESGLWIDG
jgi:hypothetical protein